LVWLCLAYPHLVLSLWEMDFPNFFRLVPFFFQHFGACRADEGDAVVEEDVNQDDDAADITSQVTKAVMSTDCQALEKAAC
jgi:hypothetical protein